MIRIVTLPKIYRDTIDYIYRLSIQRQQKCECIMHRGRNVLKQHVSNKNAGKMLEFKAIIFFAVLDCPVYALEARSLINSPPHCQLSTCNQLSCGLEVDVLDACILLKLELALFWVGWEDLQIQDVFALSFQERMLILVAILALVP